MKSLKGIKGKISGKIVIIRLDLNVPIDKGMITDTHRIDKILKTLNYLINENSKIIIISHIGRPRGKFVKDYSLKPVSNYLSKVLKFRVKFLPDNIKEYSKEKLIREYEEKILIFENIRFYPEEETNDEKFAKNIAKLGDIYVNEAFSCSHRNHATVANITKHLDSYAGLLFEAEVNALKKLIFKINKPVTCIIGGSKISTKIKVIENLIPKLDSLIIVGGMANNFIKYNNFNVGKSLIEKESGEIVNRIYKKAKEHSCKLILPIDVKVGRNEEDISVNKKLDEILESEKILDIGDKTISKIKSILKNSKTVLWNGPAGYFENPNFSKGSYEIAGYISKKTQKGEIYSVIGGGDTVAVINKKNLFNKFSFVSTAGGAFLEFLEGKELPGIKSLNYV
ncbi:MAG: phosphoglycerate kinase [Candidatus Pelagibacter sp.]|nr:phosphoglycerate kinase [Candidatus Pelagibacter sp.]